MVAELQRHIADWQHWFAAQGIAPLRIEYDSLSADPTAKLARICATLGVAEAVAGSLHPGVAKRPDATTAVWIGRYRLDAAGQA